MRIGFDARMVTHPGIGRYISCLLPELIRQAQDDEFVLFGSPEKLDELAEAKNVTVRKWEAPIYSPWEQFLAVHGSVDVDLLHVPHFNIPLFFKKRMVVTIHDLIYLLFPEAVSIPMGKQYARFMINAAMKKAEKVITVSDHTRKDLLGMFGDDYDPKVKVIQEASSRIFRQIDDKTAEADVRCRYRLSDRIILYVGSVKPHKNLETLLEVFSMIKKWGVPHQLVVCGRWDKKQDHLKERMIGKDILYLGEVPTEDLIVLYNMADALVHLSLYEGFGLTVLEAMQCGTPVIVSNASSLPEVAGKAGFAVPPHDVKQIADALYNVLVNSELRTGMIETGLEHVKQFSWERAARDTLKVYRGAK